MMLNYTDFNPGVRVLFRERPGVVVERNGYRGKIRLDDDSEEPVDFEEAVVFAFIRKEPVT